MSSSASPRFYDANEDAGTAKASWWLEAGEAEALVSDQFNFEEVALRVIFQADSGIWALRFPDTNAYSVFHNQYNSKLFENTFGMENDAIHREKVRGSGLCC